MTIFNRFIKKKNKIAAAERPTLTVQQNTPGNSEGYFEAAKDWFYDRYAIQEVIANRWQLAFWVMAGVTLLLLLLFSLLMPLKSWQPIVINRNTQTGEVWVQPAKNNYLPSSSSEVESDLVRYVIARETYSTLDATPRLRQVMFSSSPTVAKKYRRDLDKNNPKSLVNTLGPKGLITVKVQDVVFLDAEETDKTNKNKKYLQHKNLAKIDFTTTETQDQATIEKYWVATLSWEYLGTPDTQEAAWANWNGFTVGDYRVDQRNI